MKPKDQSELKLSGDYLLIDEYLIFMRYNKNNNIDRIIVFVSNYGMDKRLIYVIWWR